MLEDGWLRTGDIGYFDEDGWLFLTGRAKNVIVTNAGENIYPEEIEDYINRHPYISDSMVFASGESEDVVAVQILPDKEEIKDEFGSVPPDDELENAYKRCCHGAQYGARSIQANPRGLRPQRRFR